MTINHVKHAVCCLLMSPEKQVLAIFRKKGWALPGGKVEPNESLEVAVVRETYEETGYVIASPQPIYTGFVPGETNFLCTTFVAQVVAEAQDAPRSIPFEGHLEWVSLGALTTGPFGAYNLALFRHLNKGFLL